MHSRLGSTAVLRTVFTVLVALCMCGVTPRLLASDTIAAHVFVDQYCANCHDADEAKGKLNLVTLATRDVERDPAGWEKVVRRLRARQMPPPGKKRPDEKSYDAFAGQ